jgi:hypothetical protein
MMHQLISGKTCPEVKGKDGSSPKNDYLDLTKEVLLATAELLRDETNVGILHSMKLPEKTEFNKLLPPPDGKCVTMVVRTDIYMAVFCLFSHLDIIMEELS